MGKVQSHVETKVFEEAPPWDLEATVSKTDLTESEVNACWKMWVHHPLVKRGRINQINFAKMLEADDAEAVQANKVFMLLDKDDDGKLEFPDVMLFLFSLSELEVEQRLRRSFLMYDRNLSGKVTKEEMVEALDLLGMLEMERDDKGKIVVPENVENLFSLMDFEHDSKIAEEEFLRSTMHYRKLGKVLAIMLLERNRRHMMDRVKEFMEEKTEEEKEDK